MTILDPSDELQYEVREEIGWMTFNRPAARNALTFAMYDRIAEICRNPGERVKVIVLTGAGDHAFASGTDIEQFLEVTSEDKVYAYENRVEDVISAVEGCAVPTIAAIRGVCTGGGAVIAAACDLRIGAPSARFGMPIARTLGNCLSPSNVSRFAAIVGAARFKEIVFTARLVNSSESKEIGWLHEVVESEETLMVRAEELARMIAGNAPLTLRATKIALRRLRVDSGQGQDLIAMCYLSDDFREGVTAFLAKRPANWTGH